MYTIYKDGNIVIQGVDFEAIKKIVKKIHPEGGMIWEGPKGEAGYLGKVNIPLGC
jgi:hypothetical protein